MNEREQFQTWFYASKYCQVVYPSVATMQIALDGWQAATALHQETINSLLAVINEKNLTLERAVTDSCRSAEDWLRIRFYLKEALAITTEKVRLVEGDISALLKSDKPRKLYTIEVKE